MSVFQANTWANQITSLATAAVVSLFAIHLDCSSSVGQITPIRSEVYFEASCDVNNSNGLDLFDSFFLEPPNSSFGNLVVNELVEDQSAAGSVGVRSRISYSSELFGDILTDSTYVITENFGVFGNQSNWLYEFESADENCLTLYWSSRQVGGNGNSGVNTILNVRDVDDFWIFFFNTTIATSGVEKVSLPPGIYKLDLRSCQCSATGSTATVVQEWRTRIQWGFAGFEPGSENNPYLPVNTDADDEFADEFIFDIPPLNKPGMQFIDPLVAIGYRYNVTGNFATEVMIPAPLPNGDSDFFVTVGDQTAPITAGVAFDFESNFGITNVSDFEITGINADEELDPEDQLAFVTGITFADETITAEVTMTPLILGDVNCDGEVNLLDVGPFIDALASGEFHPKADINDDGVINLLDVGPFIDVLAGN